MNTPEENAWLAAETHEGEAVRLVEEAKALADPDPNISGEERHRRRALLLAEAQVHATLALRRP